MGWVGRPTISTIDGVVEVLYCSRLSQPVSPREVKELLSPPHQGRLAEAVLLEIRLVDFFSRTDSWIAHDVLPHSLYV